MVRSDGSNQKTVTNRLAEFVKGKAGLLQIDRVKPIKAAMMENHRVKPIPI